MWHHCFNFLHVSLTAICQTGVSSSDPRQSHRVHPVHETKKSHTPAGHRRPEEAERTAGAARYAATSLSLSFSPPTVVFQLSPLPPLLSIPPPNLLLNHSASVRALRFNSAGFCTLKGNKWQQKHRNTKMYSFLFLAAGESLQVTRTLSYWKCDTAKVPPRLWLHSVENPERGPRGCGGRSSD